MIELNIRINWNWRSINLESLGLTEEQENNTVQGIERNKTFIEQATKMNKWYSKET